MLTILTLTLPLLLYSAQNRVDTNGNFISEKYKITFKKPDGNFTYSPRPVFLKIKNLLIEYFNLDKKISFGVVALNTNKPASYVGKYIIFYVENFTSNLRLVHNNTWLLKKNAYTLIQRYRCIMHKQLYYITLYIMVHKENKNRKVCLVFASPHNYFVKLRRVSYKAYLNLNFVD